MVDIVTRIGKGSPLSNEEGDANLLELDRRTGRGWRDYPCEITVQPGALDAPTWMEFEDSFGLYAFSPDVTTSCRADIHLDHDYIPATMVYPHVHWTANVDTSGVVRFGVSWKYARRGDAPSGQRRFTAVQTIYIEHEVSAGQVGIHHVSEAADGLGILHPDFDVDGLIMCKVFRDGGHANDTFAGQVFLIKADAHAEVGQLATPLRTPPFY